MLLLMQQSPPNDVSSIVYKWLGQSSHDPWRLAMESVRAGLVARGALEEVREKKLKVFTSVRFLIPEHTRSLVTPTAVSDVTRMLDSLKETRPDAWTALSNRIGAGVQRRYVSPN